MNKPLIRLAISLLTASTLATASALSHAQPAGAPRTEAPPLPAVVEMQPDLLFRENWRLPPHEGPPTNENRRVKPDVVTTNPQLELSIYGEAAADVIAWEHDGRVDLWTGMANSPIAMTVRHRDHYMDLTGLARVRWVVRTEGLHVLYPVVKLADGRLLAANRAITTDGDFLQLDLALAGWGKLRWYNLDPQRVVTTTEVVAPDLSKVDEVGFVDLAPGGGHGRAGWSNLSTVEVYAKPVPR